MKEEYRRLLDAMEHPLLSLHCALGALPHSVMKQKLLELGPEEGYLERINKVISDNEVTVEIKELLAVWHEKYKGRILPALPRKLLVELEIIKPKPAPVAPPKVERPRPTMFFAFARNDNSDGRRSLVESVVSQMIGRSEQDLGTPACWLNLDKPGFQKLHYSVCVEEERSGFRSYSCSPWEYSSFGLSEERYPDGIFGVVPFDMTYRANFKNASRILKDLRGWHLPRHMRKVFLLALNCHLTARRQVSDTDAQTLADETGCKLLRFDRDHPSETLEALLFAAGAFKPLPETEVKKPEGKCCIS